MWSTRALIETKLETLALFKVGGTELERFFVGFMAVGVPEYCITATYWNDVFTVQTKCVHPIINNKIILKQKVTFTFIHSF